MAIELYKCELRLMTSLFPQLFQVQITTNGIIVKVPRDETGRHWKESTRFDYPVTSSLVKQGITTHWRLTDYQLGLEHSRFFAVRLTDPPNRIPHHAYVVTGQFVRCYNLWRIALGKDTCAVITHNQGQQIDLIRFDNVPDPVNITDTNARLFVRSVSRSCYLTQSGTIEEKTGFS